MAEPWNINIHYDGKLDASVSPDAASVLEVGCDDGFLAARLSKRIPDVVAVDADAPVLEHAKQRNCQARRFRYSPWDACSSGGKPSRRADVRSECASRGPSAAR
ncbi:MAG TPA: class I SAM-dependent methyltransferase [Mycobacterium sp.]|nr:class I SAM-dependent methyltransferase [Mycobacterium sp.]